MFLHPAVAYFYLTKDIGSSEGDPSFCRKQAPAQNIVVSLGTLALKPL